MSSDGNLRQSHLPNTTSATAGTRQS
jgi:hypothetical protein